MDEPSSRVLTPMQRQTAMHALQAGHALSGLDIGTLAHRCAGLDGDGLTPTDLIALLEESQDVALTAHRHDVLAQALNDQFIDRGLDHLVLCSDDLDPSMSSDRAHPDRVAPLDPPLVEVGTSGTLNSVQTSTVWWVATRKPVVEFLRYILEQGNDTAPTGILGEQASQEARQRLMPFVRAVEQLGLIEPTMPPGFGPEGDLGRVRVTEQGQTYLIDEHR